ncbi:hypothetical protein BHQ18_15695 [Mycolicibacterium flavescens]|uniref:PE family protein n=1 Tax=Mycolicibacterium flavescens TaxID=1776 RepID=A0A1E3RIW7_MYCFV|nr:hypothetical protein BHQ18_15695 [Mycolicibacterium flavescens]
MTPPVRLAAAVEPLAVTDLPDLLQRLFVPPSAGAAFPEPQFPPVVVGNSLGTLIENTYNAIEPWVQWGFEVAEYAVGWVPWVGWLAPQIMIFYNTGEQIARSVTFNFADWIDGQVSFGQGLANIGVDTVNAFIYFANAQIAFWLPPLPPIPPIGPFAAETAADETVVVANETQLAEVEAGSEIEPEPIADARSAKAIVQKDGISEDTITSDEEEEEEEAEEEAEVAPTPTSSSNGAVSAQGEVRTPAPSEPEANDEPVDTGTQATDSTTKPDPPAPTTETDTDTDADTSAESAE